MIIPFANTYAVPALDLIPTFYKSIETVKTAVRDYKNKDYGIKKLQSGGRGRPMLIDFYSLPKETQKALGDPKAVDNPLQYIYEQNADAASFFENYEDEIGSLTLSQIDDCIVNANVLIAVVKLKALRTAQRQRQFNHTKKGLNASLVSDCNLFNGLMVGLNEKEKIQHTLPTSVKRFMPLLDKFVNQDGTYNFTCLLPKRRGNANGKKMVDNTLDLLNNLFTTQSHKPNRAEVTRLYESFLNGYTNAVNADGELYDPKDFKPLSYGTISNYLAKWQNRISNEFLRSGNRQDYMNKYKPSHKLEKPNFSGSLISIDDRQPPFYYDNVHRVWFYMGIDLHSEAWICHVWGKSKEGLILEFYRQLVRNCHEWGVNVPLGLECESSLNSSFKNTFLKPGTMFDDVRIEANNARGKRIERYIGTLRYGGEKQQDGWMGRPHARNEANQIGPQGKKIIPYNDIVQLSRKEIMDWNNTPHSDDNTKTRFEVWLNNQNPNTKPISYRGILPHLGYCTPTSCNVGSVRLDSNTFWLAYKGKIALGDTLIKLMERVEGKNLQVYWLDDNEGNVLAAHAYLNNQFQCELMLQPSYSRAKVEITPEGIKAREISSSYVATIEAYRKEKVSKIQHITLIPTGEEPKLPPTFFIKDLEHYQPTTDAVAMPDNELTDAELEYISDADLENQVSWARSTKERMD